MNLQERIENEVKNNKRKIFLFWLIPLIIKVVMLGVLFKYGDSLREEQIKKEISYNLNNLKPGDFIQFNGTWYPIKQKEGRNDNIYVQIRLVTRELLNLNKFCLTNYVDSVVTQKNDREKWIEMARFHLIYN